MKYLLNEGNKHTSMQAWFYKSILLISLMMASSIYAQTKASSSTVDYQKTLRENSYYLSEYNKIIDAEKKARDPETIVEDISSGVAAIVIGLYGYYNDNRGVLTKVVYNATTTAGVLLTSEAILRSNTPSLLLWHERHFQKNKEMDIWKYRQNTVSVTRQIDLARAKQLFYNSSILGSVYFYNAYREDVKSFKNVYYFLSFNFILIASASSYKLATFVKEPHRQKNFEISSLPSPLLHGDSKFLILSNKIFFFTIHRLCQKLEHTLPL